MPKGDRSIIHLKRGTEGDFKLAFDFPKISPSLSFPRRGTTISTPLLKGGKGDFKGAKRGQVNYPFSLILEKGVIEWDF